MTLNAQSVSELYNRRDFGELVKYDKKTEMLTGEELYMVGYAFFQMENDVRAIELYDLAIAKGHNTGAVHFYKGVSLKYLKKYKEAMDEIDIALSMEPANQEFMNEKAMIYQSEGKTDKALEVFEVAKTLPNTYPVTYYWCARLYHEKGEFDKALAGYYQAVKMLPAETRYHVDALRSIGQLEYSHTKNYTLSAKAYAAAIELDRNNYKLYYKIMISYNAAKEYKRADTIFHLVKMAYEKGELPKEDMEIKSIGIAQFEWNGQVAVIRRSLVDPKEMLDISYKVFLLNKEGDKVVRRFVIEKTIQLEKDGEKHLLCEEGKGDKEGVHFTYPYGWKVDEIPLDDLEHAVVLILDGKMKPSASSSFGR